jgi:hypothetical protein
MLDWTETEKKSALLDMLRSTLKALDTFDVSPQDEHTIRNLKQVLLLAIGNLEMPRDPAENASPTLDQFDPPESSAWG